MADLDPATVENFEQLRAERGWSYATLAQHFDDNAENASDLAAWARSHADVAPEAAPVDRKAPAPEQTADVSGDVEEIA